MTDAERLIALANFIFSEGIRVEDSFNAVLNRRWMWSKEADQLDLLEVIQYMDRLEYFKEISAVVNGILFDEHRRRPPFKPLTGGGRGGII